MVNRVTIICDLSGSMMECGKRFIMRTVLRTVDQYFQMLNPDIEIELFGWKEDVKRLDWAPGDRAPDALMNCSGRASVSALTSEVGDCLDVAIVILTDGHWDDSQKQFEGWASSVAANHLRVILLGADANIKTKNDCTFMAEHIFAALEGFGG